MALGNEIEGDLLKNGMLKFPTPSVFDSDEGSLALEKILLTSSNSKLNNVRHHFLKKSVAEGDVHVELVACKVQHVNILTRSGTRKSFRVHRNFASGVK